MNNATTTWSYAEGPDPTGEAPSPRRMAEFVARLAPMQAACEERDLFASLADAVMDNLNAEGCVISLMDETRGVVRDVAVSTSIPGKFDVRVNEYQLRDYAPTRAVLHTNQHQEISVSDPSADQAEVALLEQLGFARMLMCRLVLAQTTVGLIEVYRVEDRGFRHDDATLIGVLASYADGVYGHIKLMATLEGHYTEMLETLVSSLEGRDPYTSQDTGKIRDMAVAASASMRLPPELLRAVRLGAILHDIGKIGIPDEILRKDGSLDEDEWELMRRHPELGEHMLQSISFLKPVLPIIRHHHERWDGHGYPDGLAGNDIPLGARIVAVCDAFDAMTSARPYRPAMSVPRALEELRVGVCTQFDPVSTEVLIDLILAADEEPFRDPLMPRAG